MLHTKRVRSSGRTTAQALVEFTLTAMLLLMLLMLIIEVARIFQAYVTLQAAARAGARYAITGQWDSAYSGVPPADAESTTQANVDAAITAMSSGWNPEQPDPLQHIPPCWPRFALGSENNGTQGNLAYYGGAPDSYPYTAYTGTQVGGINWDEPYRSPRTCSIEATVIRSMAGLNMDSMNIGTDGTASPPVTDTVTGTNYAACCSIDFNETSNTPHPPYNSGTVAGHPLRAPYTYSIEILGYSATSAYPISGDYAHPDWGDPSHTWDDLSFDTNVDKSSTYYNSANHDPGISRGFGGDPGQQVIVRVTYRFGLITPILSRIIQTFPLTGVATMTNEMWGSTGVQSKAVLPPPLPPLPPPLPTPANLVISSITGPTNNVPPNKPQNYTVVVANNGGADVDKPFVVTLWASDHALTQSPIMPDMFSTEPNTVKVGELTVPASVASPISAGGGIVTLTIPGTFTNALPGGAKWQLYAVADSYNAPQADGTLGAVDEQDVPNGSPYVAQEQDNVSTPLQVLVTVQADFQTMILPNPASVSTGLPTTYSVIVQNNGPADTTGGTSVVVGVDIASLISSGQVAANGAPTWTSGNYSNGVWQVGAIAAGTQAVLNIPVKVLVSTVNAKVALHITSYSQADLTFTDPDSTNNPMSCTAPAGTDDCKTGTIVVNGVDLNLGKTVDNSKPIEGAGHPFTYTLTAVNNSTAADAPSAVIYDALPVGVTFLANGAPGSNTSAGCTVFSGTLPPEVQSGLSGALVPGQTIIACNIGTLTKKVGAVTSPISVKISVYANTGQGGNTLTNNAYVTSAGTDTNPADNKVKPPVPVTVQSVYIFIKKTALPSYMPPGTTSAFTWTITVTNQGPNDATNVVIQDNIPVASLASNSVSVPAGTTWSSPNWTISTLPANTSVQMTITAKPKTTLTNGTVITNTASYISADQTNADKKAADLTSTATVTMDNKTEADLMIVKTVSPTSAKPGDLVTYTFTVTNNGPVAATNVVVSDNQLGQNTDPANPSVSPTFFFNYSGGVPPAWWNPTTWQSQTPFTLAAGSVQTFTMTLKVNGNLMIPNFVNNAQVTSALPDQASGNNTSQVSLNVTFPAVIFTNAGGTGCLTDTWGDEFTGKPKFPTHTFVPSQKYTAASVWGFLGSFVSNPPTSYNYIDYQTPPQPISSDGQNLMNCTISGRSFSFRVDNLLPGQYQIALVFADPTSQPGTHRFTITASSYRTRVAILVRNFDINNTIQNQLTLPDTPINGTNIHYLVQYFTFRVRNGGGGTKNFLQVNFVRGRASRTYRNINPVVSGVGITYFAP